MSPVFVCRARVRKQVMGEMSGPLVQAVRDAGLADNLQQYILSRDIKSVEVMASIASKIEEVDEVLADPLASAFRLPDGSEIKLSKLELPIVKAKLRFLWRKCYQECNHVVESSKPPPAAVSTSTLAKSSPKELPSGYWQQQVAKFEAVKIGSEARKFPQEKLIGAEAVIARVVHEMRTESHTAIGLHEVVQSRYFDASGNPNPLSAAKKKNKSQAAVLTINADYQIETEADIPWQPKSVLAFVDCLESIRLLLILVEMGSEASVERYFNWFEKQVRSRPHKLEQLRVYWESTSWRIALALRAKQSFKAIVEEIIHDNQSLQDALSKEFVLQPVGRPLRGRGEQWDGKGKGKTKTKTRGGKGSWDDRRWDKRYDRYDTARQSPYGWTSNSWSSPSWQGSSWSSWQQKQSQFAQDDRNVQKE